MAAQDWWVKQSTSLNTCATVATPAHAHTVGVGNIFSSTAYRVHWGDYCQLAMKLISTFWQLIMKCLSQCNMYVYVSGLATDSAASHTWSHAQSRMHEYVCDRVCTNVRTYVRTVRRWEGNWCISLSLDKHNMVTEKTDSQVTYIHHSQWSDNSLLVAHVDRWPVVTQLYINTYVLWMKSVICIDSWLTATSVFPTNPLITGDVWQISCDMH